MTDWSAVLSSALNANGGSCGSCGSQERKHPKSFALSDSSAEPLGSGAVVPVVLDGVAGTTRTPAAGAVVPNSESTISKQQQSVAAERTTGTTRTTENGHYWQWITRPLHSMARPEVFNGTRWDQIVADAERFLTGHGAHAFASGWNEKNLFGVHPLVPAARYDAMGLILLIDGGEVIALDPGCATIRSPGGALLRYWRSDHCEAICLWELA